MAEINLAEIYRLLGSLEEGQRAREYQLTALTRSLEWHAEKAEQQQQKALAALAEIADVSRRLAEIEITTADLQALRNKGIGILIGVTIMGSAGGAGIFAGLRALLGDH